jgi:hypothetical protein
VAVHPALILLRESAEMRSIASSSLTVKGVNGMFEKLSRFVGRDPLLASLRGFTPLPSGLSVFRSDARTSSFFSVPTLEASQFRAGGPRLRWDHRDLPSHTGSSSLSTCSRSSLIFVSPANSSSGGLESLLGMPCHVIVVRIGGREHVYEAL